MRNNTLNYKDVVDSVYGDDEISFTDLYDCEKSKFCNPLQKQIITRYLRTIEKNLRKLF